MSSPKRIGFSRPKVANRRDRGVHVRFSLAEYAAIVAACGARTVSETIRMIVLATVQPK